MNNLFTAANLSGLATSVSSLLIAFIGVALLFVGYRYIRKAGINTNISDELSYLYEENTASEFNRSQKTYEPWDDEVFESEVNHDLDYLSVEEFNEKYPIA